MVYLRSSLCFLFGFENAVEKVGSYNWGSRGSDDPSKENEIWMILQEYLSKSQGLVHEHTHSVLIHGWQLWRK